MKPSRSKSCQSYGATFAEALSHWRRTVAILGAAAITPMIHSRCFALPSDWYLGFVFVRLVFYVPKPLHDTPSVSDPFSAIVPRRGLLRTVLRYFDSFAYTHSPIGSIGL